MPRVTGVWAVRDLGKVYASVPGNRQVAIIDARTPRAEARVGNVGFPDGIAFAPKRKRVCVSDESGGGDLVIDGATNEVVTTIPLDGEAGNTRYALQPGRSSSVVGKNAVGEDPDVLAYDAGLRRPYVATESGRVSVFALRGRRLVPPREVTIPHAHSVSVDPRTHLVYFPLQDIGGGPVLWVMRPRSP